MKKYFITSIFLFSANLFSQVGINTTSPNSTLEVASSPTDNTKVDGIITPKLTGNQLKLKDNLYGLNQISTIVYVTEPVTSASTKTSLVNEIGYYYFDGSVWQKLKNSLSIAANNGLNLNNNTVKLGGVLSEATTIQVSNLAPLKIDGLLSSTGNSEILAVDSDGTLKKTSFSLEYLTTLSTIAKINTQSIRNGSVKTVNYNSLLKNNNDLVQYNTAAGTFTIKKAGYYQINVYNVISTNENASGQTSGTAISTIYRNNIAVSRVSTGHGERTDYIYHNLIGLDYFNVGDVISVQSSHTRTFRVFSGGTISIQSLGS